MRASARFNFFFVLIVTENHILYFFNWYLPNIFFFTFTNRDVFPLYRMSYMWYTCFGAMVTIILSFIFSLIWGLNDPKTIDSKLIAPQLRKFIYGDDKQKSENSCNEKEMEAVL